MKILFLTFYFTPDLSAGSFRNTSFFEELKGRLTEKDYIHVITTKPNRYKTFTAECLDQEIGTNFKLDRITVPQHQSGLVDQVKSYIHFYKSACKLVKNEDYDLVYASSSRLFTAFMARRISYRKKAFLYLDIRDIFVDTIKDVFGKQRVITTFLIPFLKKIERYTFRKAGHINLVSGGFKDYFTQYSEPTYSFYTNGIDDVFLQEIKTTSPNQNSPQKIITYAGNIGEGQGLEKIIPYLAKSLGNSYLIQIIGDGGRKNALRTALEKETILNVNIIEPVSRDVLIEYYKKSDFLFLHLNDYEAFKKVIPSKVFEYGVFDLPILTGVNGFAAEFIMKHIPESFVFSPGDYVSCASYIKNYKHKSFDREHFIQKFSRKKIMEEMSISLLSKIK